MIRHLRDIQARRRGVELAESGFTLIELLVVIVVLGILAATVVFALSGVTGQSAVAACNSDAKSYEIAVSAYQNAPQNTSNTMPGNTSDLINGIGSSGPFLHAAANNSAYVVAIEGDTVTNGSTGVNNGNGNTSLATQGGNAYPGGTVFAGKPGTVLQPYDSGTACNGV